MATITSIGITPPTCQKCGGQMVLARVYERGNKYESVYDLKFVCPVEKRRDDLDEYLNKHYTSTLPFRPLPEENEWED